MELRVDATRKEMQKVLNDTALFTDKEIDDILRLAGRTTLGCLICTYCIIEPHFHYNDIDTIIGSWHEVVDGIF